MISAKSSLMFSSKSISVLSKSIVLLSVAQLCLLSEAGKEDGSNIPPSKAINLSLLFLVVWLLLE